MNSLEAKIVIIMGSQSDWPTMKLAAETLEKFKVPFESKIVSAHRTPDIMYEYAKNLQARGVRVVIAGAGGAAHLPGMVASLTAIPVLGVPIKSTSLNGIDSLLSIVQMPKGVPVATLAIGDSGATNAALLAISILGIEDKNLNKLLVEYKNDQKNNIINMPDPKISN
ncbi:MAG: N5-carboxyaminoimidazole ribonucleotide mutase [Alphaproteobacteria bacterium MarineAlpha2_Bin1]|nr:MAG: N5-carboxyaminoimidazole ribonucleotide mutase [Alphaproteobacteria bacterium MarineAlpha2_Bin1]